MVPASNLLAFTAAAIVIIVVPGPGVLFTVGRALTLGRRAALLSVLGHTAGVYVALVLVAIGLGTLLAASALALTVVKFAGALYLIYLGIQAIRERKALRAALVAAIEPTSHTRVLRQSAFVGLTNPKAIVFFSAVLPHFADPEGARSGCNSCFSARYSWRSGSSPTAPGRCWPSRPGLGSRGRPAGWRRSAARAAC